MRFNKYIWDLYKNSPQGQGCIKKWTSCVDFPDSEYSIACKTHVIDELRKNKLDQYIQNANVNWFRLLKDYFVKKEFNKKDARNIYSKWINDGIFVNGFKVLDKEAYKHWTVDISMFSRVLYSCFPEYFFPYTFHCEFNKLIKICNEFNIPIPKEPKKNDWVGRATYYIDLCEVLLEFREMNCFTPQELCAFLYDFAPEIIDELKDSEMPQPSKVWFVGGSKFDFNFLDNATAESKNFWQGNVDARRGDIIVMYCVTPRSYIHSIWRVESDGFIDPFFYYYSVIWIANPNMLSTKINLQDLKNNSIWSSCPLIRKNLQGVNGYPIKYIEYSELLSMLAVRGEDVSKLPTIQPTNKFETDDLINERDVEIKLIEPFLISIKYAPTDWIRQMPVKMGRGERNFPDYCFYANPQRGNETAKMILESKFQISTQKELQEAYYQAKSYAMRLQSEKFIVAAREGIWIYQPTKGVYDSNRYIHYNWMEIENPDILHKLQQLIGK